MVASLYRSMSPSEVEERIAQRWNFGRGFPEPKFVLCCPQCNSDDIILRYYHFHKRKGKANPFRCDVCVKCTVCSMAFVFGVVVSKELYARRQARRYNRAEVERMIGDGE